MILERGAIDTRLVSRELLLRRHESRLGVSHRITRVLQLFAGDRSRVAESLAPRQVFTRHGQIALAHLDRRTKLCRRGKQVSYLANRPGELCLRLIQRDLCVSL